MGSAENLKAVNSWLQENHSVEIRQFDAIGGGCINTTGVITLSNDDRLFVKLHNDPPPRFFRAEARGLDSLRRQTSLRVPEVIHAGDRFLLLEYLGSGPPAADYWQRLGEGLAELHRQRFDSFGLETDNYCGLTPQENTPDRDGYRFFARNRLCALADRAANSGLLDSHDRQRVDRLATALPTLVPEQPAVLLHGDLWSGNVHSDGQGFPGLVDPACYRGWAEAELAMTRLFGGFHPDFYRHYEAASAMASDWQERAPLYNLYHLLNHLILFGSGYLSQVKGVLHRFT